MALRTGAEYVQALRDGREVYLDGKRVDDVTTEPGLSTVGRTFARMYDLVAENQEALTCHDEEGRRVSGTWLQPRDRDQLGWRRAFTETIARHTGGLFGRPQDYVPLFHLGPQSQEALGEIVRYLITLRAFIHAAEDQSSTTPAGHCMPSPRYVTAGRAYSVEHYRRITGYAHDIASQALINVPGQAAFDNPTIGPTLEGMFTNAVASARDRARVTRLAWDMVCDSFGSRQTLFELFNALPWTAQRGLLVAAFDVEPYKQLARATAGLGPLPAAATAAATAARGEGRDYHAVGQALAARWTPKEMTR